MVQAIQPSTVERKLADFSLRLENPAVALCNEVCQKIHAATLKQTRNTAERCAGKAFRLAMPPLSGYRNICDFIACAAYGTLLGAIKDENGSEFLYAAQVALATVPRESKTSKIQPRTGPRRRFTPPLPHFFRNPLQRKGLAQKISFSTPPNKELTSTWDGRPRSRRPKNHAERRNFPDITSRIICLQIVLPEPPGQGDETCDYPQESEPFRMNLSPSLFD